MQPPLRGAGANSEDCCRFRNAVSLNIAEEKNLPATALRSCKACISTACITSETECLDTYQANAAEDSFISIGSVIVVKLDILTSDFSPSSPQANNRRERIFLLQLARMPRITPKPSKDGSGEAEERRLSPRRQRSPSGCWFPKSGLLPGWTR